MVDEEIGMPAKRELILSNSINPRRALIRMVWTRPRSTICSVATKPSPWILASPSNDLRFHI
jgi:hypothetical protein